MLAGAVALLGGFDWLVAHQSPILPDVAAINPAPTARSPYVTAHSDPRGKLQYLLYLPPSYNQNKQRKWPLLLFLHGSDESGQALDRIRDNGPILLADRGRQFPFVIVAPLSPLRSGPCEHWWVPEQLGALLDTVTASHRVDLQRVYVTGVSMGGFGAWDLAARYPHRFAAIAPFSGGGDPARAARLADLPVWAFHGEKDPVVPFEQDSKMVDALRRLGGRIRFTTFPEGGHVIWAPFYDGPELYDWLLRQRRGAPQQPHARPTTP